MTQKQLNQIKSFSKDYYLKNDQFHDFEHPKLTTQYAFMLASGYKDVDYKILEAMCYLHDIGRVIKDEGHAYESAKIAEPFLRKIGLTKEEIDKIINGVYNHSVEDVHLVNSIEGKLLFDADKIQILSVYGFIRVYSFLIVVRGWKMKKALDFMWEYNQKVFKDYLQTKLAKKILSPEIKATAKIVEDFKNGLLAQI